MQLMLPSPPDGLVATLSNVIPPGGLATLSDDVLAEVALLLMNPLRPASGVALGGTSRGVHAAVRGKLQLLRKSHDAVVALSSKLRLESYQDMRSARALRLSAVPGPAGDRDRKAGPRLDIRPDHWKAFAEVAKLGEFDRLASFTAGSCSMDDNALEVLLGAAACSGFPRLVSLYVHNNLLTDRSLIRFAHALDAGHFPSLEHCWLQGNNRISSEGIAALRSSLQSVPNVTQMYVTKKGCTVVNLAPNGPP